MTTESVAISSGTDAADPTSPWRRHPAFEPPAAPADLARRAAEGGWPEHIVARAAALRVDREAIERWLTHGFPTLDMIDAWLTDQEEVSASTLKLRTAVWDDIDLLADLFAHSPETVGEWTVTVERSPNPFAGFRLQEHSFVLVLEDQRVGLGALAHAARNTLIAGTETSVHVVSACRVRDGLRGLGFASRLLMAAGSGTARFGLISYWYVRSGNASRAWIDHLVEDMADRPEQWSTTVEGLTATVQYLPAPPSARSTSARSTSAQPGSARRPEADHGHEVPAAPVDPRLRPVTRDDLERCVELINRTHHGLDLFRPYTVEYLRDRLDDGLWGPRPWFRSPVYGWDDYAVIEHDGQIVACGGLWDRGANIRERWVSADGTTTFMVDPTALMDFGYEAGHEAAMAELTGSFLARSAGQGRSGLLAPFEFLPELLEHCAHWSPVADTRTLEVMPFVSPELTVDLPITRPYTDLAYW